MDVNEKIFLVVAALLYGTAFVYGLTCVLKHRPHRPRIFYGILITGFILQTIGLYIRGVNDGALPVNNYFEVMQMIGWGLIMLDFILRPGFKLNLLGFFVSGLVTLICGVSLIFPGWDTPVAVGTSSDPWTEFHAILAALSYALFAILAVVSLMYLLQHYSLRKKKMGTMTILLPSIRQLEEIATRLISVGVILLSISILIGALDYITAPAVVTQMKMLISIAVLLAYVAALFLHKKKILITARFAWLCLILFAGALLTLRPLTTSHKEESPAATIENE